MIMLVGKSSKQTEIIVSVSFAASACLFILTPIRFATKLWVVL
jgi:hypothetical protein